MTDNTTLRSNSLLLLTSCIWGLAFVAQRVGMEYIGPFLFNGIRFLMGSLSLLPLILYNGRKTEQQPQSGRGSSITAGILAGAVLFVGASLQQMGVVYTTAGKAGFITGLYVVLVPILGIALKEKTGGATWFGAILALVGLYLLSGTAGLSSVNRGDLLVFFSAFFWAAHVHIIGRSARRIDPLKLSAVQFAVCGILSLATAFLNEPIEVDAVRAALVPLLYGGLGSVGIAYTLQAVAQKHAKASHAAIILSMEGVFAFIGGVILLNEPLTLKEICGGLAMLTAMFLSQGLILPKKRRS